MRTAWRTDEPHYGDNIYAIGAALDRCLRQAEWPREKIAAIHVRARAAKSYAGAIAVYREYITIHESEEEAEEPHG